MTSQRQVLVLGGSGMLGHELLRILSASHRVCAPVRRARDELSRLAPRATLIEGFDFNRPDAVESLLGARRWDVVVNVAGVIKQQIDDHDPGDIVSLNALLPHRLAKVCAAASSRLVHFSTDCVFSGTMDSLRGPDGYRLEDPPDARDFYGLSKLLGEPHGPGVLCLRTSIIGRQLYNFDSLVEWFLRRGQTRIPGYTNAWFTGTTSTVAARLVNAIICEEPDLCGTFHVAAQAISKHDLLKLAANEFGKRCTIVADDSVYMDRRLDGRAFRERTGWVAPSWPEMIAELAGSANRTAEREPS